MGAAHIDAGALGRVLHLQHIHLDTLRRHEHLPAHLFVLGEHGIRLTQINADVPADITLYHAGHHILLLLEILVVNHAALFFPDLLQDHVLGILSGNAAELPGLDLHVQDIAHLGLLGEFPGILQGDLQYGIFHIVLCLHHFLLHIAQEVSGLTVDLYPDIVRLAEMILAGGHQRVFYSFKQCLLADLLLLLQNVQCIHQFLIHFLLFLHSALLGAIPV